MMLVNDYVTNEKWVDTESLVRVAMTILLLGFIHHLLSPIRLITSSDLLQDLYVLLAS